MLSRTVFRTCKSGFYLAKGRVKDETWNGEGGKARFVTSLHEMMTSTGGEGISATASGEVSCKRVRSKRGISGGK